MKKISFITQNLDTTCFPVALINCGLFLNKKLLLDKYIEFCCCKTGGALNQEKAIIDANLPLLKTDDIEDVLRNGGIITIMHPIYNLHAVFVYPDGKYSIAVNSWLGPNETVFDKGFHKFLANPPNNNIWYINNFN